MTQRTPRRTPRGLAAALAVAVLAASCVPPGAGPDDEEARPGLAPSFPAEGDDDGTPAPTDAPPATDSPATATDGAAPAPDGTAGDASPGATPPADAGTDGQAPPVDPGGPGPTTGSVARSAIADPRGDVEPGRVAMRPPDHADLVGAEVERSGDGTFTLRIDLDGGAPDAARDSRHTMNVASFYDVDGDGTIDYEVWANLSSTGWGTSQFDNREGTSAYGADDEVAVEVADGRLVLTFPSSAVGDAPRFRWALAAEWGTYEDLQLGTTSRDLAPDDQQPAHFPG